MKRASICLVAAFAVTVFLSTVDMKEAVGGDVDEPPSIKQVTLEEMVGLPQGQKEKTVSFVPGDSLYQKQIKMEEEALSERERAAEEARKRDLLARERVRSVAKVGNHKILYADRNVGYNCVAFAKQRGFSQSGFYLARNIKVNSEIPKIGGFVVTYESVWGHVAEVVGIGNDTITVHDSNVIPGYVTERVINASRGIKGYVN